MATPVLSPTSPHSKPTNLSRYETPELRNMYINTHHNAGTVISAIFTLSLALVLFAFNNGPTTYRYFSKKTQTLTLGAEIFYFDFLLENIHLTSQFPLVFFIIFKFSYFR